jgi:hypothetical protein
MSNKIITTKTHPDHHTVGKYFGGSNYGENSQDPCNIYFCDSYDPSCGYWLTNVKNPNDRKNVSERSIGRTFYLAYDMGDHWSVSQWNINVKK